MLKTPIIQIVQQLHQTGKSSREISRLLGISRNTVRKLLRQDIPCPKNASKYDDDRHCCKNFISEFFIY